MLDDKPAVPRFWLCLVLVLFAAPIASAHDYWIEPSEFRLEPGGRALFHLRVGESFSGEPAKFSIPQVKRFQIASASRQFEVLPLQRDPAGMARLMDSGLHAVSFENTPTYIELPAERFNAYLEAEGLAGILQSRQAAGASHQPGKESYSRCAKSLLWVDSGPTEGGSTFSGSPVGLTLELVPETNPYRLQAPAPLTFRLLYEGRPVPGALVMALSKNAPNEVQRVRSDADGRAAFTLRRGGPWLVKAVHMVPAATAAPEDWRSYWASLTFELPAGP